MDADALLNHALRCRRIARGINDERTVSIIEQMAREFEARAALAAHAAAGGAARAVAVRSLTAAPPERRQTVKRRRSARSAAIAALRLLSRLGSQRLRRNG